MNAPLDTDLAPLLAGSVSLLAAIARIECVPACEAGECVCGTPDAARDCGVHDRDIGRCACQQAYALDGRAYCSLPCVASVLLAEHHPAQDQSDAAVARVLEMMDSAWRKAVAS